MKKRLAIFVFYDNEGVVDDYKLYLLDSLTNVVERLIIVVNGYIRLEDSNKLKNIADDIFYRENIGFDGGAYKDAFCKYIDVGVLDGYDEIVMMNDTFYGPLFPWNNVFEKMESKKCDFWGLSRFYGGGKVLGYGANIQEHIQGYFIVCNKSLFMSDLFARFWSGLEYPKTYQEAIENFEIGFSVYFKSYGLGYCAYSDYLFGDCNRMLEGQVLYMTKAYELISDLSFPVLKRKALRIGNFEENFKYFDYIRENTDYDVELILKKLIRQCESEKIIPFNPLEIYKFYRRHDRVFIYGAGNYGKNIAALFKRNGWRYEAFIVSDDQEANDKDVICYERTNIKQDDGIILAVGERYFGEIYNLLKAKHSDNQLLLPVYR
jgi:rhamnosyltransferase